MAKNKKRKGASIKAPATSPKKYIQTKARQLPIYACYINQDWESSKLAQIVVARKHTNGNLTFAAYLTDLLGLGVKDTMFNYNQPIFTFDGLIKGMGENMIICDYALAHNLIYGAADFAYGYAIKSHKDWDLTQYLLEEDTEAIPLIEFEFGINGKPVFLSGNEEDDHEDYWDDEEEFDEEDLINEAQKLMFKTIDLAYGKSFPKGKDDFEQLIKNAHEQLTITEEPIYEPNAEMADSIESIYNKLRELTESGSIDGISNFQKHISEKITQYPENPIFHNYLANSYFLIRDVKKGTQLFEQCVIDFPDYLLGRLFLAFQLIQNKKYSRAWEILEGKYQLQELMPSRKIFHIQEVYFFYAVVSLCIFFRENDFEKALPYYDLILSNEEDSMNWFSVETAVETLSRAKVDALEKKYGKDLPEIVEQLGVLQI